MNFGNAWTRYEIRSCSRASGKKGMPRGKCGGKAMRVLVTGHKGYIGMVLVPMLLREGHEVFGLDSDLFADCTFGDGIPIIPDVQKDVRDVDVEDLEGYDAVMHLAGLSNDPL